MEDPFHLLVNPKLAILLLFHYHVQLLPVLGPNVDPGQTSPLNRGEE